VRSFWAQAGKSSTASKNEATSNTDLIRISTPPLDFQQHGQISYYRKLGCKPLKLISEFWRDSAFCQKCTVQRSVFSAISGAIWRAK
jgi:hypothetical protein